MLFATINDDVVNMILPLLDQEDALRLACTCRSLREPSMRRALSHFTIRGTYGNNDRIQSFCDYLLAEPESRPLCLRSLFIHDVWKRDNLVPAFTSLATVLRLARSLRELYIARQVKFVIDACPAFAEALASVESLNAFDSYNVDWDVVSPILSRMPSQLRVLRFEVESSRRRRRAAKTQGLHHFVNSLTTLILYHVPNIPDALDQHTVWPHVHTLSLFNGHVHSLRDLSCAFPNVRALRVGNLNLADCATPPAWSHLDFANIEADIPLACPIHHLQLAVDCQDRYTDPLFTRMMEMVGGTSCVALSAFFSTRLLHCAAAQIHTLRVLQLDATRAFWDEKPDTLIVSLMHICVQCCSLIVPQDSLLTILKTLPLRILTIEFRFAPSPEECEKYAQRIIEGLTSLELVGIIRSGSACVEGYTIEASDVVRWDFSGCAWYQALSLSTPGIKKSGALSEYSGRRLYDRILDELQCRLLPVRY